MSEAEESENSSAAAAAPVASKHSTPTASHTPGPWRLHMNIAARVVSGAEGPKHRFVADCRYIGINKTYSEHFQANSDEAKANARLIAAAPDLLERLRETHAACAAAFRIIAMAGLADALEIALREASVADGFGKRANEAIVKASS